jgi:hypothetical protein
MPKTRLGRWAGGLFAVGVVLLATLIVAYNTEALGGVFEQGTAGGLALWVVTAVSVIGTLATGAVSLLRLRDRSVVVVAATIFGFLATLLLVMGALPQA